MQTQHAAPHYFSQHSEELRDNFDRHEPVVTLVQQPSRVDKKMMTQEQQSNKRPYSVKERYVSNGSAPTSYNASPMSSVQAQAPVVMPYESWNSVPLYIVPYGSMSQPYYPAHTQPSPAAEMYPSYDPYAPPPASAPMIYHVVPAAGEDGAVSYAPVPAPHASSESPVLHASDHSEVSEQSRKRTYTTQESGGGGSSSKKSKLNSSLHQKLANVDIPEDLLEPERTYTPEQQAKWEEMFRRLVRFKATKGHCRVPEGYEDSKLVHWVGNQRKVMSRRERGLAVGRFDQNRIDMLNSIGFEWARTRRNTATPNDRRSWEEMFQKLATFKETHGHTRVPVSLDAKLANWVRNQRTAMSRMKRGLPYRCLNARRIKLMDSIGFAWLASKDGVEDDSDLESLE